MIKERIEALRKREAVCWDMSEVFLHAKDAHGLHDMGVEIQGIQWAIRELEPMSEVDGVEAGKNIERAAIASWFRHTARCIRKDADEGLWHPLDEYDVQNAILEQNGYAKWVEDKEYLNCKS
jgi:hypothetical protein